MRRYTNQSGRARQDGQGRFCSNRMAGERLNRKCGYRRDTWLGPLQPFVSIVANVFRSLQYFVDQEIDKVRIKSIEQFSVHADTSDNNATDSSDPRLQVQVRLTNPDQKELLTNVKK